MSERARLMAELNLRRAVRGPTLMAVTLLVLATAGAASAADDGAAASALKGAKYRMADAVMADRIIRYTDPIGDQLTTDGAPVTSAPDWSDLKSVYVAGTRTPAKLRTKMKSDHPPGSSDSFYGSVAQPRAKERIVFVAVEMAKRLPGNARGQVVEVGLAGEAATPVQVGTDTDSRAGVELFSLSGLFRNGAIATGDTDIIGREPGADLEDADYYDTDSGVYGFYDSRKATWYLAIPRAGDSDEITVTVRSTTGEGVVMDRLDLPDGGHFIDLREPLGGFDAKADLPRLACRSLETFSGEGGVVELSDVDATLVRYTAGVDASTGARKAAELLAPAVQASGPAAVALTAVGAETEPLVVDGELAVTPQGNAISLTFESPAGQWRFTLADEPDLRTAAGERIVDHSTLTGPAGVLTGPGLDGVVAGDPTCADGEEAEVDLDAAASTDGEGQEEAQPESVEPEA